MDNGGGSAQIVRFGIFEADLQTGELRKNGLKVPLQGQPFQAFAILLQHSGKLVTREELRQEVWPEDTFVDFDHGLNTAITKIRTALGDDADNPRFVETLPRRGYRFIGAVSEPGSLAPSRITPNVRFERLTARRSLPGLGAAFLVLIAGIGIWRFSRKPAEPPLPVLEVIPLVAMPGEEDAPAFSPDGNQVAFLHIEEPNNSGIYVTLTESGKPLRLTDNPGDRHSTWSPDGRQIAFTRFSGKKLNIFVVPALGGTERRLYTTPDVFLQNEYLNWAPDGKALAFTETSADTFRSWISLLSLADLTARALTSPQVNEGDCEPAFSPDGSTVAFVRSSFPGRNSDLFVLPAKGGELRQLTFDHRTIYGLAWTKDGNDIVFSSSRGGAPSLWRIPTSGGTPQPVHGVGSPAYKPSIAPKGNQLVYRQSFFSDNIWRLDLKGEKNLRSSPVPVTATSRGFNRRPSFSPDGQNIAFDSNRLGYSDIWYCHSDGSNCEQLTSLHGESGTARWSPDGHYIAFESQRKEHTEIYVVEVPGGQPRLVPTFPGANNGTPNWSRDGQWIYFYSDHQGRPLQLWKVPFQGGPAVRVTRNGGVYGVESDDGRFLYYSKYEEPGIWRMPVAGGEEVRVLDQPAGDNWYNWALTRNGIYFLNREPLNGEIKFFEFATGRTIPIFGLEKPASFFGGLALSPDGNSILYGQEDFSDSYIMLVKNFR
jgi:Tol biopolymer transport system component/DNA-binding winged helix-turn-helix (wHTH) protein